MTTEIVKNMSPRLPPLHRYAQHLEDILEPKPAAGSYWSSEDFEVDVVVLFFLFLLCFGLALP